MPQRRPKLVNFIDVYGPPSERILDYVEQMRAAEAP